MRFGLNKLFISIILSTLITGCGYDKFWDNADGFPASPVPPPPDKELAAQNKFQTSDLATEFHANGVLLKCEKVCSQITDAEIDLLHTYKDQFFALKNKITRITLDMDKDEDTSFSAPSKNYGVFFPVNITSDQLDEFFLLFQTVKQLENATDLEIFVSSVSIEVESALKILINNHELHSQTPLY